jgi:hypothetical protein
MISYEDYLQSYSVIVAVVVEWRWLLHGGAVVVGLYGMRVPI